jgi:quercetin dioxygenase-like cupin family protein
MRISIFIAMTCVTLPLMVLTTATQSKAHPQEPQNITLKTETEDYKNSLKPGSNEMLRTPTSMADGIEVIISDVIIPPNSRIPRHYHPGEEFIYIIEGSVVHVEENKPEQILKAGDTYVIAPKAIHAPYTTTEAARAVVFRVHREGEKERILVDEK